MFSTTIRLLTPETSDSRQRKGEKKMAKLSAGIIIVLAASGVFLTLVTAGIIATQTVASNGIVSTVNVGVYSDS